MKDLLIKIKQPWGALRLVRLALSVVIGLEGYHSESWWMMIFAAFFLYQSLANVGCSSCPTPVTNYDSSKEGEIEIEYEEVK